MPLVKFSYQLHTNRNCEVKATLSFWLSFPFHDVHTYSLVESQTHRDQKKKSLNTEELLSIRSRDHRFKLIGLSAFQRQGVQLDSLKQNKPWSHMTTPYNSIGRHIPMPHTEVGLISSNKNGHTTITRRSNYTSISLVYLAQIIG
jgi:hypothetical protein